MFKWIVILLSVLTGNLAAQNPPQRYVAITFDDLPVVCRCEDDAARREVTEKLLATFKKFNMPVLGVVNEQKLETDGIPDPLKVALLQQWLSAGHELGNHGYSHKNINEISFDAYKEEILKGERITRPLAQKAGRPFRFYRHPYLSAGDNLSLRKDLDVFLREHNYQVAPNTITYQDYTFSGAYETALRNGDTLMAQRIRDAYLPYTLNRWEAAEQQSRDLFGREIKQILMVHANRLNADAFGDVAKMMQDRGYTFISIDEAMTDPVYARPDTFNGNVGVTWLSRWAKELGKSGSYGSTQVPEFVLEVTRAQSPVRSAVYNWNDLKPDKKKSIETRSLLRGSTQHFESIEINAYTLPSGSSQRHDKGDEYEALIILKEGTLETTISGNTKTLSPGGVALILPGEGSSLSNTGRGQASYFRMTFKSKTAMDNQRGKAAGGSALLDWNDVPFTENPRGGRRQFFERPTAALSRLEMHTTKLNEGLTSHAPHTHPEEEVILLLTGEAEMQIGEVHKKVQPGGLVFIESNILHGIRNTGKGSCEYFAFTIRGFEKP